MKALARVAGAASSRLWLWRNRATYAEPARSGNPRLLVDVSNILRHDAQTGIQRVVRAVWSELKQRSGSDYDLVPIYAGATHGYCYAPEDFLQRSSDLTSHRPVTTGPEDKFLGLDLSTHLLPAYRKQLSAWTANGTCIALLVYDLLPLSRPEWFSARAVNSFRKWFEILKNDAHLAICISNEVAADFQRRVESKQGRGPLIGTIRMGADIAASLPSIGLSPHARQFLERTRFRDYVLMVGTVEPRKGYHFALQVFEHLWRKSPNSAPDLVIAGKAGWKTGHLQQALRSHPQRGKRLHWLQDASDEALCRLYRGCSGVFVASYGEGFGLPLVEAAMFKKPVLARSLGVFCEHGLGNVSFFHDDSIDLVGDLLMQLGKRECRIDRTTLPTWNTCVDDLLSQLLIENKNRNEPGLPLRAAL